jgi:hypothetical protein
MRSRQPESSETAGLFCAPHRERLRVRVRASETVEGTPLCRNCFRGAPVRANEEFGGGNYGERSEARLKRVPKSHGK